MNVAEIVLGLVVLATVVASLAHRLRAPAPSLLVIAGVIVGVLPGVPGVRVSPDLVLYLVLPPVLFVAATEVPVRDLRAVAGAVFRLAFGLVAATAVAVALVVHAALPQLTLATGLVLGAILASTDPVAVTALARRLPLPRRVNTLVQAESLLNDATSLVLFTVAVHVVVTGSGVSWPDAVGRFFMLAGGGVATGLVLAWLSGFIRARTEDALIETAIALLTPYATFVVAQTMHFSGVTAVVVAGITVGARGPLVTSGSVRLQITAVYDLVVFLLESVVFSLIGLELPQAIRGLPASEHGLVLAAVAVVGTILATRLGWLALSVLVPRQRGRPVATSGWRAVAVMSWAGTRGVVPLAAALSIPLTMHAGEPFPHRDLLLVLATITIVVTLVVQGLTLGPLVRRLGVVRDVEVESEQEVRARRDIAQVGLQRLRELAEADGVDEQTADRLGRELQRQLDVGNRQLASEQPRPARARPEQARAVRRQLITAQAAELRRLAGEGIISPSVQSRLQRELDLEEARLRPLH